MPERKYDNGSQYRYGFNGKENDNEVKGEGNQQDYGMRIYDPRLGRFLSVDPLTKTFPYYSPYHYASNSPLKFSDLDGGEPQDYLENWVPQTLFQMSTGKKIGTGGWMEVTSSKLGRIDVQMVYDKWTKQCWFIHSDEQGNHYYLKNDDNISGNMHIAPGKNNNWLTKGEFEKFDTQNKIQARLGGQIADAFGVATFTLAATVAAAAALPFAISAATTATANLTTQAVTLYGTYGATTANVVNNYVIPLFDESGQAGSLSIFEKSIVSETQNILNSKSLDILKKAASEGVEAMVEIGGRNIHFNPNVPGYAMTLHGFGEFVLGKDAFKDTKELAHTILWELYRLGTQGTKELSQEQTSEFTNAAKRFADKAINEIK
jgi:RHS repeat-associated protein